MYLGDPNYTGSTSSCEAFSVTKASPKMSNTPSPANPTLGSGVRLTDSVSLSGAYAPTGMITFKLVGPCACTVYADTVTVSADGTYTTATGTDPGGMVPNNSGAWSWTVQYSGDANNLGTTANASFTVAPKRITIGDFAFDDASLSPQLQQQIAALASTIKATGASRVTLTGYANPGPTAQALSLQRAMAVKAYLGVELTKLSVTAKVTAIGGGSTVLLARAGSLLNRRVVATL